MAISLALLLTGMITGCGGGSDTRRDSIPPSPSRVAGNCTLANPIPCPLPSNFPDSASARDAEILDMYSWEDDAHSAHGERSCGTGCKVMIVVTPETRAKNLDAGALATSGHFIGRVRNTDPSAAKISREFGIGGGDTAYWVVRRTGGTAARSEFWSHKTGTWKQVGDQTAYGRCDNHPLYPRSEADFSSKPCPLKTWSSVPAKRARAILTSWPPPRPSAPALPTFDVPPLWVTCKYGCCTVNSA
ncbi:MAG: hypothetical protein M3068_03885 [Gemmatimonadota bacterium]|nr:hypothetical protein [Gemmatimonadota bacterium]